MDYNKQKIEQEIIGVNKLRGHEMFPQSILQNMPGIYETDELGGKAVAHIKAFHPLFNWYWYLSEFDGDRLFYGLVIGHESEFGVTSKVDLEIGLIRGLPFERDLSFEPISFEDIVEHHRKLEPDRYYPTFD